MRLYVKVNRHELPEVKLLWKVTSETVTVSNLLEHIADSIPLESDGWGLEDYVVEVRGYECLHYQEIWKILSDDDEICVRPLRTTEIRARTVSGRHQISAAGAHLIDGVAFGRPYLRQPNRPPISIPSRKRQRICYDYDTVYPDTLARNDPHRQLTHPQDREDPEEEHTANGGSGYATSSSPDLNLGKRPRNLRSGKVRKSVSFDESSSSTLHSPDEEDDEDFQPTPKWDRLSQRRNNIVVDEGSEHESTSSSSSTSSDESSNLSPSDTNSDSSSKSESDSDSESSSTAPGLVTERPILHGKTALANNKTAESRTEKNPATLKHDNAYGSQNRTSSPDDTSAPCGQVSEAVVPPGQGKMRTQKRNARRKMQKELQRRQKSGVTSANLLLEDKKECAKSQKKENVNVALKRRRDQVLQALKNINNDTEAKKSPSKPLGDPVVTNAEGQGREQDSLDFWRHKINLTAVECLEDNVHLPTPPFPFRKRWYQSNDQRASKKRKRSGPLYEDLDRNSEHRVDYVENSTDVLNYEEAPLVDETDLPAIPGDIADLPTLSKDDAVPGVIIAFKQFEVSSATQWQPGFSEYRTAVIEGASKDKEMLYLTLAKRDRPELEYDSKGNRIYKKFEGIMNDPEETLALESGKVEILFEDMVEPKIIAINSGGIEDVDAEAKEPEAVIATPAASQIDLIPESVEMGHDSMFTNEGIASNEADHGSSASQQEDGISSKMSQNASANLDEVQNAGISEVEGIADYQMNTDLNRLVAEAQESYEYGVHGEQSGILEASA